MSGMNTTYRNSIATHGASLITHIGLVDHTGTELTGVVLPTQEGSRGKSREGG